MGPRLSSLVLDHDILDCHLHMSRDSFLWVKTIIFLSKKKIYLYFTEFYTKKLEQIDLSIIWEGQRPLR